MRRQIYAVGSESPIYAIVGALIGGCQAKNIKDLNSAVQVTSSSKEVAILRNIRFHSALVRIPLKQPPMIMQL
jgi:hypothetical protein